MQITSKTFIVTGGASGLGLATAKMVVAAGGNAVLVDVNPNGASVAEELGPSAIFVKTDVTNADDAQAAVDAALAKFGAVHGLANCAGIVIGEKVVGREAPHKLDTFAKVIGVNLIGAFNMLRVAAFAMAKNEPGEDGERGVIVNTASIAAFDGQIGQAAYAASKGGVVGMTLPIARELARTGIRVVSIAPGTFETPMMAGMPQEVKDSLGRLV
ncbi:MAG: SDR family NAD(P)-dependent oxidoreductase, partial [Zavarzinia sp.]|nr:SDR family NAD(P)-dependent oxidoreductase [Zavarzinia sp.]